MAAAVLAGISSIKTQYWPDVFPTGESAAVCMHNAFKLKAKMPEWRNGSHNPAFTRLYKDPEWYNG